MTFPDLAKKREEYYKGLIRFAKMIASTPITNTKEIEVLYEAGDIAGAQKLILAELEKQLPKDEE